MSIVTFAAKRAPRSPALPSLPGTWVFPVAPFEGRRASVSDGFTSKRTLRDGTVVPHLGVDLMFARRRPDELASTYPPRTPNGSPHFFMPDNIGALAAAGGTVAFAARTPQGCSVSLHHADRWATYYTHLAALDVRSGQTVRAGDRLGTRVALRSQLLELARASRGNRRAQGRN